MTNRQIENRIVKLSDIDRKIKELEKERDAVKAEIIGNMDGEVFETGTVKATYVTVKSAHFDSKQFKSDNPETYAVYVREQETKRFNYRLK